MILEAEVLCFSCRKAGHRAAECPTWAGRCFRCRGKGHVARDCPHALRRADVPPSSRAVPPALSGGAGEPPRVPPPSNPWSARAVPSPWGGADSSAKIGAAVAAEMAKVIEPLAVALREMGGLLHKLVERVEALERAAMDGDDFPELEYQEFLDGLPPRDEVPPRRDEKGVGTEFSEPADVNAAVEADGGLVDESPLTYIEEEIMSLGRSAVRDREVMDLEEVIALLAPRKRKKRVREASVRLERSLERIRSSQSRPRDPSGPHPVVNHPSSTSLNGLEGDLDEDFPDDFDED